MLNLKVISKTSLIAVISLTGGFPDLFAQDYNYVRRDRSAPAAELGLSLRFMLSPDVSFSGLGNVGFREDISTPNDPFNNKTFKSVVYDDGYIVQDFEAASLVGGGEFEGDRIPTDDGQSANFRYIDPDQRLNGGTQIAYHLYSAEATDPSMNYEGDADAAMGWEVNYTRFINRKRSLALQFGFSFSGFDTSFDEDITSNLIERKFIHDMTRGTASELNEVSNVTSVDPFQESVVRNDDDPLVSETVSSESEDKTENAAIVNPDMELRSSIYNFRLGPIYNLNLGRKFSFRVGAGISALYYSGRFSAMESLGIADSAVSVLRDSSTTEENEWQVGPYVDATAHYNITDRMSLFSGLQYQSGKEYSQANEERTVNVDFSSQVYVQAGFGIKF